MAGHLEIITFGHCLKIKNLKLKIMFIDTHCHLNFQAYKDDVDEVIRRALDGGIAMIIPGTDITTSKRGKEIAEKYQEHVSAAVGLHPVHLQNQEFVEEGRTVKMKAEVFDKDAYARLCESGKVVAIGEVGLDYHYLPREVPAGGGANSRGDLADSTTIKQNKQLQQLTLLQQLELAYELDKPAIIHCREAHDDTLRLLQKFYDGKRKRAGGRGVIHCFSGDWELAWQYFELGFIVSFTGLVTFNDSWDDILRKLPLDKFMIETDSPFMAPISHRGQRNEPAYVRYVAEHIAKLKNTSVEAIARATSENARRLFGV